MGIDLPLVFKKVGFELEISLWILKDKHKSGLY